MLNPRVVGIDLSLTGTGLAAVGTLTVGGSADLAVRTIKSTGRKDDTLRQRRERIYQIASSVARFAQGAQLAVIEGPSFMSKGGSNWDRAGLWWSVVDLLMLEPIDIAVAPPTVVKKFAAGKGNADKTAVAGGIVRLWGERCSASNDNEYDALTLATMGAQRLGIPGVPTRAHHEAALASVAWDQPEGAAA
jgi:Holliday junction resolvasome RuvABC endonuclease subunit